MKAADVKIGMKVVPANNKLGDEIKLSEGYNELLKLGQPFFVVDLYNYGGYWRLTYKEGYPYLYVHAFPESFDLYDVNRHVQVAPLDLPNTTEYREIKFNGETDIILGTKQFYNDKGQTFIGSDPSIPLIRNHDPVKYGPTALNNDPVNRPSHYISGAIECIDAISEAVQGLEGDEAYLTGNAIKYLWRWKKKNGVEDLKKFRWYLDRLIKQQDNEINSHAEA